MQTPAEPVAVEDLFSVLHRDIEAGEFPQAVKVADQGQAPPLSLLRVSAAVP
jgi:hypothetical protein